MTSGLTSVVVSTPEGATAEVQLIGNEGAVGCIYLLGPATVSTNSFVQIEGTALRIPYANLKAAFHGSEQIRGRILEYVQEQILTVSQIAACNGLHEAEERLARWLLMAQDRNQSDILNFTQEFLGMMLGARRTTVSLVAGTLQRAGLIEYSRGKVKILNREGLEDTACDCYRITKELHANLYREETPTKVGWAS